MAKVNLSWRNNMPPDINQSNMQLIVDAINENDADLQVLRNEVAEIASGVPKAIVGNTKEKAIRSNAITGIFDEDTIKTIGCYFTKDRILIGDNEYALHPPKMGEELPKYEEFEGVLITYLYINNGFVTLVDNGKNLYATYKGNKYYPNSKLFDFNPAGVPSELFDITRYREEK